MSTRDFFKNSVLEAFGQVDPAKIGLSLLVALAMGILIYYVYKRFFTGVVYSRSFAVTLVGMCVLTCMVTLAISTNGNAATCALPPSNSTRVPASACSRRT